MILLVRQALRRNDGRPHRIQNAERALGLARKDREWWQIVISLDQCWE